MIAWIKCLGCLALLGVCGYVLHSIAEWDGESLNGQDMDNNQK